MYSVVVSISHPSIHHHHHHYNDFTLIYSSFYLFIHSSIHSFIYISMYYLSTFIHISIYPFIYPFIYLSDLSIYPSCHVEGKLQFRLGVGLAKLGLFELSMRHVRLAATPWGEVYMLYDDTNDDDDDDDADDDTDDVDGD